MTQKTKQFKQFLTFTILAGFLFGCQKEEFYEMETNSLKVNEYTFNEANRMPMFNKAYHKVINGINSINSTSRSENVGFVIDSSTIKAVTVANATTYTMRIIRPTITNSYFENLIINVTTQDSTKAFITKYTPTEVSQYVQEHESLSFQGTGEIKEVAFETNSTGSKIAITCIDVLVCDYEYLHLAGEKCGKTRMMRICVESQGGAGGEDGGSGIGGISIGYGGSSSSTGTGGNTGGSAGNGSNGGQNPPIVTAPVPPCTRCPIFVDSEAPCEKLTVSTNKAAYKQKFRNLNTLSVFKLSHESGFNENIVNGALQLVNAIPIGTNHVKLDPNTTSYTHVHNNHFQEDADGNMVDCAVKILSPRDLENLLMVCMPNAVTSGIPSIISHGDMISNEGIFSLAILDTNINISEVNLIWPKFVDFYRDESKEIINKVGLFPNQRKEALQIMMLQGLKDLGLENKVGLFEGTVETLPTTIPNTNPPLNDIKINWNRKTLKPDGTIDEKPC